MRRRATAVSTNFFPKDNTVPYPHSVSNRTKKATPQGRPGPESQMGILGVKPSEPTGRLVTVEKGAVGATHWCPDAIKQNILEWSCPDCGEEFYWSLIARSWFAKKAEATA